MANGIPIIAAQQPQVDLGQSLASGLRLGETVRTIRQGRQAEETANALKIQYKTDLAEAFKDPSPTAMANLITKYPQQREAFTASWKLLDEDRQRNELSATSKVYAALQSGNTDIAEKIVDERIEAMKNSGEDTSDLENIKEYMAVDPKGAAGYTGVILSSIMGPEKFASTFKTLEEIRQIPTETQIKQDELTIKKDNTKLRTLEAKLRKEDNNLKREELQNKINQQKLAIEEKQTKIEEGKENKVAEAENAISNFENTITTVNSIINNPALEEATGMSSFLTLIPGTDARDVKGLVDTLQSQLFVAQVEKMKGLGSLSESEGKKLGDSITSLDMGQSTTQFKKNLNNILTILDKAKKVTERKFKDELSKKEEVVEEKTEEVEVLETRTTPDGRTIVKLSNGKFEVR